MIFYSSISCEIIMLTVALLHNVAILCGFITQSRLPLHTNETNETSVRQPTSKR